MKKLVAVLLAAVATITVCLSLTACGNDTKADWDYINNKGEMVVGYTVYDPFGYTDENGNVVGFDVELARAVANKLGIKAKFQIIDWNAKVTELNARNIDVIWNAMTITDTLKNSIDISEAYCKNNQAVVVKSGNESAYGTKELIKSSGEKIALESGSSAQLAVESDEILKTVGITKADSQLKALQEVAAGTSKIAVVDVLLFDSLKTKTDSIVNSGSLVKIESITFPAEEFGIGFRKGSDFKAKVENAIEELKQDGTYAEIAAKYNLSSNLVD